MMLHNKLHNKYLFCNQPDGAIPHMSLRDKGVMRSMVAKPTIIAISPNITSASGRRAYMRPIQINGVFCVFCKWKDYTYGNASY